AVAAPPRSGVPFWTIAAAGVIVASVAIGLLMTWGKQAVQNPPVAPPPSPSQVYVPGAIGEYYVGHNFEALVRRIVDPKIDFEWTGKAPWPDGPTENFSVRWRGSFEVPQSGSLVLLVR